MIDKWLSIVSKARGALRPETYQEWQFIVGSQGTLQERTELGKAALEMLWLAPNTARFNLSTASSKSVTSAAVTNAVSPLAGDYPMQRGVKKE